MKRSNAHVWSGLGFVLAAIMVAGGIYLAIRLNAAARQTPVATEIAAPIQPSEAQVATPVAVPTQADPNAASSPENLADGLEGTFAESIASHSACEGSTWNFGDGTFNYEGDGNGPSLSGQWQVANGTLFLTGIQRAAADYNSTTPVADMSFPITKTANGIKIGNTEFVSCAPTG